MRAEFEALHSAMHSAVPLPRECVIRASVRKMSSTEARAHAALVVRAFAMLARNEQDILPVHRMPRPGVAAPVVSLFAEA
jgi:hypothetical protein